MAKKNAIIKKNFELLEIVKKAPRLVASLENTMINRVNKSIQDNLDAGKDYKGRAFKPLEPSTVKMKGHSKPLINRGRNREANSMRRTKITRATKDKLIAKIDMTGTAGKESTVIGRNGKPYKVKRKNARQKIGALQNQGYMTSERSIIKKVVKVPAREWFGIPPQMQGGGREFNKFLDEFITKVRNTGYLGRFKKVK